MTDDLVKRLRTVFEDTLEVLATFDVETYSGAEAYTHVLGMWETMKEAASRIEFLEAALLKIHMLAEARSRHAWDDHAMYYRISTAALDGKKGDE